MLFKSLMSTQAIFPLFIILQRMINCKQIKRVDKSVTWVICKAVCFPTLAETLANVVLHVEEQNYARLCNVFYK